MAGCIGSGVPFRATAAAAARARLVVEGAVEAFGNGYVGMDVGTAVRL